MKMPEGKNDDSNNWGGPHLYKKQTAKSEVIDKGKIFMKGLEWT